MNIVGKWNISETQVFNIKTFKLDWRTAEDIMADESAEDYVKESLAYSYIFTENGRVLVVMPIPANVPKEKIDAAVASGEFSLYGDSYMIIEEKAWKEENGRFFLDTGAKGEVLGEKASSWVDIKETADGIEFLTYRLVKE